MIDKKPEYKGEGKVWESLSDNLPGEAIVYNSREVNGREFDFCILMKNVGMIIIEVKGWLADSIFDVAGVDEIIIQGYDKPEKSPKKQARAYRFGLLNLISDKYNVSPLIFDLVCYPFISKKEYYDKRLDIVSEEALTLFKEDLSDPIRLGDKLLNAYNQCKSIPHAEMDEELMGKIRQHFEPHFQMKKPLELNNQVPYSVVIADAKKMEKKQIHDIVDSYLKGTKTVVFVESEDVADSILYRLLRYRSYYEAFHRLSKHTSNLLLLSATPVQQKRTDYLDLLRLILPEKYDNCSKEQFDELVEKQGNITKSAAMVLSNIEDLYTVYDRCGKRIK